MFSVTRPRAILAHLLSGAAQATQIFAQDQVALQDKVATGTALTISAADGPAVIDGDLRAGDAITVGAGVDIDSGGRAEGRSIELYAQGDVQVAKRLDVTSGDITITAGNNIRQIGAIGGDIALGSSASASSTINVLAEGDLAQIGNLAAGHNIMLESLTGSIITIGSASGLNYTIDVGDSISIGGNVTLTGTFDLGQSRQPTGTTLIDADIITALAQTRFEDPVSPERELEDWLTGQHRHSTTRCTAASTSLQLARRWRFPGARGPHRGSQRVRRR
jgi:hypothetical protein